MSAPIISVVVAVANNGVIGMDGKLPWRIPEDLRWFRQNTIGKPMIVGRKTWDSFPKKPLPNRTNIVLTRDTSWQAEGAVVAHSWDEAVSLAGDVAEITVAGGEEIYKMALPVAGKIYLTNVGVSPEGDAFMPPFDRDGWKEVFVQTYPSLGPLAPGFTWRILERI